MFCSRHTLFCDLFWSHVELFSGTFYIRWGWFIWKSPYYCALTLSSNDIVFAELNSVGAKQEVGTSLLAMIAFSAAKSYTPTRIHKTQWRIYIVKFWTPPVLILSISCSFWEYLAKSYVGDPRRVSWIRNWSCFVHIHFNNAWHSNGHSLIRTTYFDDNC